MGAAKRRKLAGTMPERTPKKRNRTRYKEPLRDPLGMWQGYSPMMFTMMATLFAGRKRRDL